MTKKPLMVILIAKAHNQEKPMKKLPTQMRVTEFQKTNMLLKWPICPITKYNAEFVTKSCSNTRSRLTFSMCTKSSLNAKFVTKNLILDR